MFLYFELIVPRVIFMYFLILYCHCDSLCFFLFLLRFQPRLKFNEFIICYHQSTDSYFIFKKKYSSGAIHDVTLFLCENMWACI